MKIQFHSLGENAVIAEFGTEINEHTHKKVQAAANLIETHYEDWMIEYVPAFTTITLFYDPVKILKKLLNKNDLPFDSVCRYLAELWKEINLNTISRRRTVEIPVCYGGELGPDLEIVAKINDLAVEEVIQLHSSAEYLVYMIGFAPGFPYLGGMSPNIAAPRKESPSLRIPARSVGIAGLQTGIYPLESPGGWQIIGRTPLELFRPTEKEPGLLRAGDTVKFRPISLDDFRIWEEEER